MRDTAVVETELEAINGIRGYEAVVARTYFPSTVSRHHRSAGFHCKVASDSLGPILMTRMHTYGSCSLRHGLEQGGGAAIMLVHFVEGALLFQGNRSVTTKTGDLMLVNAARPLEVFQEKPVDSFAFRIPAAMVAADLGNLDDLCLIPVDSSAGAPAVLRDTMDSYWRQRKTIHERYAGELVGPLGLLIGAAFRDSGGSRTLGSLSAQTHFLRIRDLVLKNISNPSLSAEYVSEKLSISKSYLFAIMKAANLTLGRFILEQRLGRARDMLAFPMSRKRSISEIAYSVGFRDPAHFSRRFAERFGESPKAYRSRALASERSTRQ